MRIFLRIANQKETGHAGVDVEPGDAHRVVVVPVGRGPLVVGVGGDEAVARRSAHAVSRCVGVGREPILGKTVAHFIGYRSMDVGNGSRFGEDRARAVDGGVVRQDMLQRRAVGISKVVGPTYLDLFTPIDFEGRSRVEAVVSPHGCGH